jgi:hypothetical protein
MSFAVLVTSKSSRTLFPFGNTCDSTVAGRGVCDAIWLASQSTTFDLHFGKRSKTLEPLINSEVCFDVRHSATVAGLEAATVLFFF